MYAVIKTGGKQYRVAAGEKLKIEQIPAEVGAEITLDQILMLGEGEAVRFAADRPHGYRNRRETPAVFHNLIHYAQTAGSGVLVGDQPRI